MSEKYSMSYVCSNCQHRWSEDIEKGKQRPALMECPRCGCADGRPSLNQERKWPIVRRIWVVVLFLASSLHADDGRSLVPLMENRPIFSPWRDVVLVEHFEGVNHDSTDAVIPTYTELVLPDFTYVSYVTGEEELYDMRTDPYQLENLALVTPDATMNLYRVVAAQMKICSGPDCFKRMPRTVVLPALTRPRVYPNPFNPETRIEFDYEGEVTLKVYNVLGQEVWNWQGLWPGQVVFDGTELSSGIYFCHIQSRSQTFVERMVMIR